MKLGLVSDIHGHRHALEAVVADAARHGVERWWALGDLVAIGPEPVQTLELLAKLPAVQVTSGTTERYVLTEDRPPPYPDDVITRPELLDVYGVIQRSFAWTCGAVAAHGWLDWLRDLPLEVRTVLPDGTAVLGVHASPGRDDGEGITPHRRVEELERGAGVSALAAASRASGAPGAMPVGLGAGLDDVGVERDPVAHRHGRLARWWRPPPGIRRD